MTKEYIEAMTDGDVAWEAYCVFKNKNANLEWLLSQLERGIGDVAWVAYCMVNDGIAGTLFAKNKIELGIGSVYMAAYSMVIDGHADDEWKDNLMKKLEK